MEIQCVHVQSSGRTTNKKSGPENGELHNGCMSNGRVCIHLPLINRIKGRRTGTGDGDGNLKFKYLIAGQNSL